MAYQKMDRRSFLGNGMEGSSVWYDPITGYLSDNDPNAPAEGSAMGGDFLSSVNASPPTGLNFTSRGTIDPQILDYYKNNPAFSVSGSLGKPITAGGYQITPTYNGVTGSELNGNMGGGEFNGVAAWDGKDPKYQKYDTSGNYLGDMDVDHSSTWTKIWPLIPALFSGGALATYGLTGAAATTAGAEGLGAAGAAAPAVGLTSEVGGGGALGGGLGGGAMDLSAGEAIGAANALSDTYAAVTPEAWSAAGLTGAGVGAGAGALSTLANTLGDSGLAKAGLTAALPSLLNGGGDPSNPGGGPGGSPGGGGLGDLFGNLGKLNGTDLSGLLGLLGGGLDAYRQGKAAQDMKSWLDTQQGKIDKLYSPGSPEFNSLWDQMSRSDAAAGRNSQYGPRSVDLAARIAQIKADETTRFTTGTSRAYADALNQNASRYAGLNAGLNNANTLGGGLGSLLNKLFGGGTTPNGTGANTGLGNTDLSSILNSIGVTPQQMTDASYVGAANDLSNANDYAGLPDGAWGAVANGMSPEDDPFSVFW
jgi:hypothetical protein